MSRIIEVSLDDLVLDQPDIRLIRSEEFVRKLAKDIEEHGLLHPITVYEKGGGKYGFIDGVNRAAAFKILGRDKIPAMVLPMDEVQANIYKLKLAVLRQPYSPLELAEYAKFLHEKYGWTYEKIAEETGFSRRWIIKLVKLTEAPQEVKEKLKKGRIRLKDALEAVGVEAPRAEKSEPSSPKEAAPVRLTIRCDVCGEEVDPSEVQVLHLCKRDRLALSRAIEKLRKRRKEEKEAYEETLRKLDRGDRHGRA